MSNKFLEKVMLAKKVFILIAITSIILAACGGPTAEEAAPVLEPVTLQLQWVTQAQFAGYYVALDKGWYEEEGIDLTIIPGGPDQPPIDLITSGTRDFATVLLADLAKAVEEGNPVIGIAQIQQENGLLLIAKKSSGIQSPEDFAGKRVGIWLGSWQAQFDALMAQQGLTTQDFTLVSQGFSMDPFINDELDVASAMIYNEYHTVLESGFQASDVTIINYADFNLGFPGDTLFTTSNMANENPELCAGMVRASLRGWQYAIDNPEEAVDIVLKYDQTGVQNKEHQLSMMTEISRLVQISGRQLGRSDNETLQRTIDTLVEYGILNTSVPIDTVMTNEFWEISQNK